jgi:hypothetical protein
VRCRFGDSKADSNLLRHMNNCPVAELPQARFHHVAVHAAFVPFVQHCPANKLYRR